MLGTASKGARIATGTLTMLAGVIRGVGAAVEYAKATAAGAEVAFPWMAVIMGVIGLVNGISIAFETAEERLERLTKEAEELSNKAKEVKANYNTLERSAKKLDELKEKRYDSAEAAEEY
jgi:uncharacterized membrane protein (DUF106 family)